MFVENKNDVIYGGSISGFPFTSVLADIDEK